MPIFDMIVIVDWSASATRGPAKPGPDRCWLAWQHGSATSDAEYFRTRQDCKNRIVELISDCSGNVFVGFDFPLGYPAHSGLGGGRHLAARLNGLISDPDGTANNRFCVASDLNAKISTSLGPFWGCPAQQSFDHLAPKKPDFSPFGFSQYRIVEARLRQRKKQIMTVWQLLGSGSVGSQVLTGLPITLQIAQSLAPRAVSYWPFETNWEKNLQGVVLGEIWPSLTDYSPIDHPIKDARQVIACRDRLWRDNLSGTITDDLSKPDGLSDELVQKAITEEGWILGVD